MANKRNLDIIWLEPKSSIFVKKKIVETILRKRVKSGDIIKQDAIVNVLYRTKYYKARIVSTYDSPVAESDDSDEEPLAKISRKHLNKNVEEDRSSKQVPTTSQEPSQFKDIHFDNEFEDKDNFIDDPIAVDFGPDTVLNNNNKEITNHDIDAVGIASFVDIQDSDHNYINSGDSDVGSCLRSSFEVLNSSDILDENTFPNGSKRFETTLKPPTTLSEQIGIIEQQNRTIMETQGNLLEQIMAVNTAIGMTNTNLDYLINLIKSRSAKTTPTTNQARPDTIIFSTNSKPIAVRNQENPEKIRLGNTSFEMDYSDYANLLQRSGSQPSTFAVKLLSTLFTDNELYGKNVTGKSKQNLEKTKLNASKLDAILRQLTLQFPQYMETKENRDKIWNAINGKCRKTTEKMDKTVFQNVDRN